MTTPAHAKHLTIALVGNPNTGKSTLFTALAGVRQHVGNYPGVTVEKKVGRFTHAGAALNVVDLPARRHRFKQFGPKNAGASTF